MKFFLTRFTILILLLLAAGLEYCFYKISQIRLFDDYTYFHYFFIAFGIYLIAVLYIRFYWGKTFFSPEFIVSAAIAFRLTLLFSDPILSDDIYRYVWDGHVANHSVNPYWYAPQSDNLIGLRDTTIYPHINHKDISTIYPPVAQALFRVTALISNSVLAMKIMLLLFDLGILFLILWGLRISQRPLGWALLYAWNPLAIVEVAHSGHMDVIGIFFLILALILSMRESIFSYAALSFSVLSKFFSFSLFPFLEDLRAHGKKMAYGSLLFLTTLSVFYFAYADSGDAFWTGLRAYVSTWEFNSSLYAPLYAFYLKQMPLDSSILGIVTENAPRLAAKLSLIAIAFLGILSLYIYLWRKPYEYQKQNIIRTGFVVTAIMLLINPTLHPWYVLWIIPFLCFYPNAGWILFTGTVFLSYFAVHDFQYTGVWKESLEIRLWEYVPLYGLILIFWAIRLILRHRSQPPELRKTRVV